MMKRITAIPVVTALMATLITACGSFVGFSRSVNLTEWPDSACVVEAVDAMTGVSSVRYQRLSGSALGDALYVKGDSVVIHEYRYRFDGFENAFQFSEETDGAVVYRHEYQSNRGDGRVSDTDELIEFISEVEDVLARACDVDMEATGSTRVCARLFGGCENP